jgi:hypothetical protein
LSLFGSEQQEALEFFQKYIDSDDEEAKKELAEIRILLKAVPMVTIYSLKSKGKH